MTLVVIKSKIKRLSRKQLIIQYVVALKFIDLYYFVLAGQEDYDRLRPLAYPLADVFLVCFSLVRHQSLMSCQEKWMPELRRFSLDVPVILVGNKCDMRADEGSACTHIPWQDGHKMARQLGD